MNLLLGLLTWMNVNFRDGTIPNWIYYQNNNPHKVVHYYIPCLRKTFDALNDSVVIMHPEKPECLEITLLNGQMRTIKKSDKKPYFLDVVLE